MRILLPIILGLALGLGLGWVQSQAMFGGYEERFSPSRSTLAEDKGELTREEVLAKSVGTPRVEVPNGTAFKFGNMKLGESMSHEFLFRNTGDGPLNLTMGSATCKCTIGDLEKSILKPGEETLVKLTWTPKAAAVDFSQSATIITTDPVRSEVQLTVSGKVGRVSSLAQHRCRSEISLARSRRAIRSRFSRTWKTLTSIRLNGAMLRVQSLSRLRKRRLIHRLIPITQRRSRHTKLLFKSGQACDWAIEPSRFGQH